MRIALTMVLIAPSLLVLSACLPSGKERLQTETMDRYETIVRWGRFDAVLDFIHPEWREDNPIEPIELERLNQFQVSQYRVQQVIALDDGSGVDRLVRLRLYNNHTARERVVDYVESWRWDEERERWMLHSGLPDPTRGR